MVINKIPGIGETTIGKNKTFYWEIDRNNNLTIYRVFKDGSENKKTIKESELEGINNFIKKDNWTKLSNNVEKLSKGDEQNGLGKFLFAVLKWSNTECQLAGHIGAIFCKAEIWENNGLKRGIEFRKIRNDWRPLLKSCYESLKGK